MNFIVKNLGWILLLVFFVFMLFIISSNGKKLQDTSTGSNIIETMTGEVQEDLDNLVEMLDEDGEEENSSEEEDSENNESESSNDEEIMNSDEADGEEKGFFSKIFGGKNEDDSDNNTDMNIEEDTHSNNDNLVKDSPDTQMSLATENVVKTYAPEVLSYSNNSSIDYPGINLETAVGEEYQIGVHSLKLNNKYFNKTLAYMLEGDIVKQLTEENSYGCFQVEIISAQNPNNVGKLGYVCKKYLADSSKEQSEKEVEPSISLTKVGDIITVEVPTILDNGIILSVGDQLDQMSPASEDGCFTAHVLSAQVTPDIVPVGTVCLSDIK